MTTFTNKQIFGFAVKYNIRTQYVKKYLNMLNLQINYKYVAPTPT